MVKKIRAVFTVFFHSNRFINNILEKIKIGIDLNLYPFYHLNSNKFNYLGRVINNTFI